MRDAIGGKMRYPNQVDYYRQQASRVRKRAELALTQEQRRTLLELAQRWERLAGEPALEAMPGISDETVRREARMFAKRYPANAAAEAAHYASRAGAAGDQVNFELWSRIAKAILEMDGKRPSRRGLH